MLKIEEFVTASGEQWKMVIKGMRNPMNSWDRMDSVSYPYCDHGEYVIDIGENDHGLMMNLAQGGDPHAKYRRMLPVWVTIDAPLYWWKEFDTYKVGTVSNSCSTMHKIHAKPFKLSDFSTEHLLDADIDGDYELSLALTKDGFERFAPSDSLNTTIIMLNVYRKKFLETSDAQLKKRYWWQMIQLLPSSYNQKRTIFLNYQVLYEMYNWRKNHKLDEWRTFCKWIEELPYSELITLKEEEC